MPPAPMAATISYGPRRVPEERGMGVNDSTVPVARSPQSGENLAERNATALADAPVCSLDRGKRAQVLAAAGLERRAIPQASDEVSLGGADAVAAITFGDIVLPGQDVVSIYIACGVNRNDAAVALEE